LNPVREAFLTVSVKMTTSHYFLVLFETAFIEGVQDFKYKPSELFHEKIDDYRLKVAPYIP